MTKLVTHLIVGLGKGGAETMLYQLLRYQSDSNITQRVISLGASHYYEEPIRALGVDLIECNLHKHPVQTLWRTYHALRHTDTLCCWMYHANFLGYFLGRLVRVPNLIWCIRQSNLDPKLNKMLSLQINNFCAKHSGKVSVIAYNGDRARAVHETAGYCHEKGVVLDNGCNCGEYTPMADAKARLQEELQLPKNKKIVLSVTRDHPIKDIPTFLMAFCALHKTAPDTVAVLCGSGIEPANEVLAASCAKNGLALGKDIFLLGLRHDVPILLAACDLYVLHSKGEAFPNALLQAMSCGCLCLTTDVGDALRILGQEDCVVPTGEAEILSLKMQTMLTLAAETADAMRKQNRTRVLEFFDIHQIVKRYEELF